MIKLTDALTARVQDHEGLRTQMYLDSLGKATIGIGHLIQPHERERYAEGVEISMDEVNELFELEPMRLLREERNRLLQETDWRFRSDLTPSQEWIDYSQALRDLPSTSSPELDENGQLSNVTWPTKPE